MSQILPGLIISFREALEAFLILVLMVKYFEKTGNRFYIKTMLFGFLASLVFSLLIGLLLFNLDQQLNNMVDVGKLWESIASLAAVVLVTTFIVWMINHGSEIKSYVEQKASLNLSQSGIFIITFILISREGVEIAIFAFAGKYHYLSIILGTVAALFLAVSIYYSLLKVKISSLFNLTLVYLIIQAGYLLGYGIHEGLSAMKSLGYIGQDSFLLRKLFDASAGILNHKDGYLGLPLNVLFGWYSKPEWIQFVVQYLFTFSLFLYWSLRLKNHKAP